MSEPNTSEPLHSSCTRHATRVPGSPSRSGRRRNRASCRRSAAGKPQVRPRHQLREHAAGLLEQIAPQRALMPKRRASPGRCQTGSMAALVTRTSPFANRMLPSGEPPAAIAATSSGILMWARVMAMVGRTSMPAAMRSAKAVATCGDRARRSCPVAPLRMRSDRHRGAVSVKSRPVVALQRSGRHRRARDRRHRHRHGSRSRCGAPDWSGSRSQARAPWRSAPPADQLGGLCRDGRAKSGRCGRT